MKVSIFYHDNLVMAEGIITNVIRSRHTLEVVSFWSQEGKGQGHRVKKVKFQLLVLYTLILELGLPNFNCAPFGPWDISIMAGDLQVTLTKS